MVQAISHITLIVSELGRSSRIVVEVLGGREIYDSKEQNFSISREKFFDVEGLWLVLMEGPPLAERTYNHIAFKVDDTGLSRAKAAITKLGLEVKPSRPRTNGEGQSVYFYDYDNHLVELHTGTLCERLREYRALANDAPR